MIFLQEYNLPDGIGIWRSIHRLCLVRLLEAQLYTAGSSAGHVLL